MKINKSLLPIKLHYFLRYAGSAFMAMALPLIVRQKGVSAQGIGFLWTVMPIVSLIASSFSGALADFFRAHRAVFLSSLVFSTTGIVTMYGLPSLPLTEEPIYNTLQGLASLPKVHDDVLRDITSPEKGMEALHNLTSPSYVQNASQIMIENFNTSVFNLKRPEGTIPTDDLLQNLIDPEMTEEGQIFPPNSKLSADSKPSTASLTLSYLMSFPQFWFIFMALLLAQVGIGISVMMQDAICFQILGTERHKYGQQRLWGTIGMGILSIVNGALVDLYSKGLSQTDYLPAVIVCLVLMTSNVILVAKMRIPSTQESKMKMGDVGSVLSQPQTVLFFLTVYVMGASLGQLWIFKLMYIEDTSHAWDPNFSNLKLLQGLDLGIETFGGEVPFFFLSGMIIQRLGHTAVFAASVGTLSLRCCLYYLVSNPWWFLPIEFLNGISYGLFHACMASYASHIAPPGAQATLQAFVRASFTAGMSTAGFLGGSLYQSLGGATMFLLVGMFDAGFCLLFVILQILITKYYSQQKTLVNTGYIAPSDSSTSGKDSSEEDPCATQEEKDTKKSLMDEV